MDATSSPAADFQRQQDRKRKRKALLAGGVVLGLGAAMTLAAWSDDVFADGVFNTGSSFELQGAANPGAVPVNTDLTFKDYDGPDGLEAETAPLQFNITATDMVPSGTVYAPLTIATSSDTDDAGTFTLASVEAAGPYANLLTYRVYKEATHGANCSAATAANLTDEWTNPTEEALGQIVGGLSFLRDIPLVGGLLDFVLGDLVPTTRPVVDTLPVLGGTTDLAVGANQTAPQHLCIAVTMGLVPPAAPSFPLPDLLGNAVRNINEAAVDDIDAGDTTVTWQFTGEPAPANP